MGWYLPGFHANAETTFLQLLFSSFGSGDARPNEIGF